MHVALVVGLLFKAASSSFVGLLYQGGVQLAKINDDGKATPLGPPLENEAVGELLAVMDRNNGVYYFLGDDGEMVNLIGLNSTTGSHFTRVCFVGTIFLLVFFFFQGQ